MIPFYSDTIVVFGATSVLQGRLVFLNRAHFQVIPRYMYNRASVPWRTRFWRWTTS